MIKEQIDLDKIKEKRNLEKSKFDARILVGMSSCGLAAGAKDVYEEFKRVLMLKGITNVDVVKTFAPSLYAPEKQTWFDKIPNNVEVCAVVNKPKSS